MLKNYVKLALKVLMRRKFFTFISLFGISFTLLVLMVATAMIDQTFAPQSPESNHDRTVAVFEMTLAGKDSRRNGPPSYALLDKYVRNLPNAEETSIFSIFNPVNSFTTGHKQQLFLKRTDAEFWRILDFEFIEGRGITEEDEKNGHFVAVINAATREKIFAGAPAVGKQIDADGQTFKVIGVVRDVPIVRVLPFSDMWVPLTTAKSSSYKTDMMGGSYMAMVMARTPEDVRGMKAEFVRRLAAAKPPNPESFDRMYGGLDTLFETTARVLFGGEGAEAQTGKLMAIIVAAMILFMILPTVNLVNINLSRIMERASEIGVRKAFGASSRTLIGQFVAENVILTLVGSVLGLVASVAVLTAINELDLIPYTSFSINFRVFLYGVAIAIFFGLFSGVYPAWRMSRLNPVEALRGRSR